VLVETIVEADMDNNLSRLSCSGGSDCVSMRSRSVNIVSLRFVLQLLDAGGSSLGHGLHRDNVGWGGAGQAGDRVYGVFSGVWHSLGEPYCTH
jgi:hypothetical protein